MADGEADFTQVFRHLADALNPAEEAKLLGLFNKSTGITDWLKEWRALHSESDTATAVALMRKTNPIRIPRNHRVEEAIQAANGGDYQPFHRLNEALQNPFNEAAEFDEFENAPTSAEVVCETFCGT